MEQINLQKMIKICHRDKQNSHVIYYWHRLFSLPLTLLFYFMGVKPNTISVSMILISVISFVFMVSGINSLFFVGYGLVFIAFLFDKIDGDLARLYSVANIKGSLLDFVYHRISLFLFYMGLGVHYHAEGNIILVVAALCGFFGNYIEEMQLLPYRVYAHKHLFKGENVNHPQIRCVTEFRAMKYLKIFRFQIFSFYYFIGAMLLNNFFAIKMIWFLTLSLACMLAYSIFQLYYYQYHKFDADMKQLLELNEKLAK